MICMNEVQCVIISAGFRTPLTSNSFGAPIPPGMGALARGKTSPQTAHKLLIVGHRFRGPEALKAGWVVLQQDPCRPYFEHRLVDVLEPTGDKTVERALQMAEASAGLSANAVRKHMATVDHAKRYSGCRPHQGGAV
jgi:enoyl-CoA hydratase/carnithine racemase